MRRQEPTEAQRRARAEFDLEAFMLALPPMASFQPVRERGAAGYRLCGARQATLPDDLLREFACDMLKAQRCSAAYLAALRVVLWNQAEADRCGYVLEMNQRVPFATPRVMRTIIDQMRDAGLTFPVLVKLGCGRSQVVQCYGRHYPECKEEDAADELERLNRRREEMVSIGRPAETWPEVTH